MRLLIALSLALAACSKEEQDRAREDYLNNCRYEKTEEREWPTVGRRMTNFYACHQSTFPCHVFVTTDGSLTASDCQNGSLQ